MLEGIVEKVSSFLLTIEVTDLLDMAIIAYLIYRLLSLLKSSSSLRVLKGILVVLGAGCMLPLSHNVNLSRDLGMRHRAGIGMSENSDAVVVIVSEETGSISVAIGGMLKRHLKPETLENLLRNELLPQEDPDGAKQRFSLLRLLRSRKDGGADDGE